MVGSGGIGGGSVEEGSSRAKTRSQPAMAADREAGGAGKSLRVVRKFPCFPVGGLAEYKEQERCRGGAATGGLRGDLA
jgi:hypothetical protein